MSRLDFQMANERMAAIEERAAALEARVKELEQIIEAATAPQKAPGTNDGRLQQRSGGR